MCEAGSHGELEFVYLDETPTDDDIEVARRAGYEAGLKAGMLRGYRERLEEIERRMREGT